MKYVLQWIRPGLVFGRTYSIDLRCYTAEDVALMRDLAKALKAANRNPKLFIEESSSAEVPF